MIIGDTGEPRDGTLPIELIDVDMRLKDPRLHRPYFVWQDVRRQ